MLRFWLAKLLFLTMAGSLVCLWILAWSAIFQKQLSHRVKYYMWLAVLFSFLIPLAPVHTPKVVDTTKAGGWEEVTSAPQEAPVFQAEEAQPIHAAVQNVAAQVMHPPRLLPDSDYTPKNNLLVWAACIWFFAGLCLFGKKRLEAFQFRRRLAPLLRPADPQTAAVFQTCRKRLNIRGSIRLRVLDKAVSPFLTGLFRPTVVIPAGLAAENLELIFCHELIHYRRMDLWYGLFTELVCQLHWFNPLVWAAAKKRRAEMEFSCDEAVAAVLDENQKKLYVITILNMMRSSNFLKTDSACLTESGMNVKKRLEVIMKHRKRKYSVLSAALAAVMLCTSVVSVYAVNSQNPVTSAYTENYAKSKSYFAYSRECAPSEYGIDDNTGYGRGVWESELINTPLKKAFTARASLDSYMLANANRVAGEEATVITVNNGKESRKTKQADIQVEMTEFTEALSDGHIWKGKFTVIINGVPVMENQPGCVNNVPAAQSRGNTGVGIIDTENKACVVLTNISFSQSGTDTVDAAAIRSKYCEALFNSSSKIDIYFDHVIKAVYAGREYTPRPEWEGQQAGSVVADPVSGKADLSLAVSLGRNYALVSSPYDSYTVTEDSVSGMFYLQYGGSEYIDCFQGTLSGLSAGSETASFQSADGRFSLEQHKGLRENGRGTSIFMDFAYHTEDPEERGYTESTLRAVNLEELPFTITLEPDNQHITVAYKQNTGIQRWHTAVATYNFNGNDIYETRASSRGDSSVMTLPLLTDGSRHYIYAQVSQYVPYALHTDYDISFYIVDGRLYFTHCSASTKENKAVSGYPAVLLWERCYIHD